MYAQCPECLTIFSLGTNELGAARGRVRCAHCNAVFDALLTLCERLPPEPIHKLQRHAEQITPPQLDVPVFRPNGGAQRALFFDPDERPRASERASGPPLFARRSRHATTGSRWWLLANFLLALTLGAEIAWAERARWIDHPRARALLDGVCATVPCRLPLRRDRDLLHLASRDIRPHPSVAGALIISATLHNAADFTQPFPVVEITLSDLDEQRVAMRRFQPLEYVADADTLAGGLGPAANAAIVFEVADPGKDAVAFEFRFE